MAKNDFIHSLMKPSPEKVKDRSVWGLPLRGLWIPFLISTNVTGESHINAGALGAPLRLALDKKTGVPRLKGDGMPRYVVADEVGKAVKGVKDNFAFGLMTFITATQKANPTEYKAQVEAAQKAGEDALAHDEMTLNNYLAEVEAVAAKAMSNPPGETPTESKEKELVAA